MFRASRPEEYGGYYAWGETVTKSIYSWDTYKWDYEKTKYCTGGSFGAVDNKTQLELADDVAHVKWGGNWRMPTKTEYDELIEKCTWTWITQNGNNGFEVTSKKNGKSIFLPAAGFRDGNSLDGVGFFGFYFSSSLYRDNSYYAYGLSFYGTAENVYQDRYAGQSVRPVCP